MHSDHYTMTFHCRNKSRSVDHGFSPPFDLDSLRSKVEGRFESVGRGKFHSVTLRAGVYVLEAYDWSLIAGSRIFAVDDL
jgi:hypothetical protein